MIKMSKDAGKIQLITTDGCEVVAQAPIIVSASRSTDIPAFYADWFFHRLEVGYSVWTNPFNGVKSYISYANTRFVVFWSKNPEPLLPYLHVLKEKNIGCYIQYTLNDYVDEKLETGVPSLEKRIETFKALVKELGIGRVVWRFDPMILTETISIDSLLKKVEYIGDQLKGFTEKLVFSYADIKSYRKVESNLKKNNIPYIEWTEGLMEEFAYKLSALNKDKGWNYELATCGEKIDIEQYGIKHNRCIDRDLIKRIMADDEDFIYYLDTGKFPERDLFGQLITQKEKSVTALKDKGQRPLCGCMSAKDIGEYNTCPHLCEYCYANANKETALRNYEKHNTNPLKETIT